MPTFRGNAKIVVLAAEKAVSDRDVHIQTHMGCKSRTCAEYRELADKVANAQIALMGELGI